MSPSKYSTIISMPFWWWSQALTSSLSSTDSTWLKQGSSSSKTPLKIGLKLKEDGCTWNLSFPQKTYSKKWRTKSLNSTKLTSTGSWLCRSLLERRTCGTTSKVKSTRQSLKTVISYWTKFKKAYHNISKQKEDASQDSSSSLMRNCWKYWHKLKIHRQCRDTLTSALKVLDSSRWVKESFQAWSPWRSRKSTFQRK